MTARTHQVTSSTTAHIAFIGGGNMASAIIGGLLRDGLAPSQITVVEPFANTREALTRQFQITALPAADATLQRANLLVWAIKPQVFEQAASAVRTHTAQALHLSVAAGIRSDSIANWLGTERIVRAMPNTPALIGQGMTALFARDGVDTLDKALITSILSPTGELLWVDAELQLDAVTALSGSGPAYVFYFLEAMTEAGVEMGLSAEQAYRLALGTFTGASELARRSPDTPEILRQRVTSKGGTTYAAITTMDARGLKGHFKDALLAAQSRAKELGDEFGGA
jgi:pyrroline-5-carboxylate reductase